MDNSSAIYDNIKSECQQTDTNVIKMREKGSLHWKGSEAGGETEEMASHC